nr:response regulator transcription factor [uncultured Flavobacterium sp.]
MKDKIKLALLDDECLFLEGLAILLQSNENISIIYKDSKPEDFVNYLKPTNCTPDIIIIDLNMEPLNGIQVLEEINKHKIEIKTIVLSSLFNSTMYGYMIKYGISAFLPKYTEREELFEAIETVHKHKIFVNKENQLLLQTYLNNPKKNKNPWNNSLLSEREIEVIKCICQEMSTKEIADDLCISAKTVETHRSKIMEKIDCKNVIGVVTYAFLNGLYTIKNI